MICTIMGNRWLRTYMVCSYTYTSLLSSESTCLQIICTHCVILSTCCIPLKLTSNCIYHLSCRHMAETCHTLGQHMHVTHAQPLFSWPPRAARRRAHVILVHKKTRPIFCLSSSHVHKSRATVSAVLYIFPSVFCPVLLTR